MMKGFQVEVHTNGIVITPLGLNSGSDSKVYEDTNIEQALLEMYRKCVIWNVGDKIKIEREEKNHA